MAYDARQIANYFIRRAGEDGRSLSIMAVLKLAYIAHGWTLALLDRPLFHNRIEAWRFGPVIVDLYEGRSKGADAMAVAPYAGLPEDLDEKVASILRQVWKIYGDMHPYRLSDLTHVIDGPWHQVVQVNQGRSDAEVPDWLIQRHYMEKNAKALAENV